MEVVVGGRRDPSEFGGVGEWDEELGEGQRVGAVSAGGRLSNEDLVTKIDARGGRVFDNVQKFRGIGILDRNAVEQGGEFAFGDDLAKSDRINMTCRGE